jgi:hypothetical protein
MWMETGDCHIFFTEETDQLNPRPSLRLHVSELEKARSTLLSNLVRYSTIDKDEDEIEIFPKVPSSRYGSGRQPLTSENIGRATEDTRAPRWDPDETQMRPPNSRGRMDSSKSPMSPRRLRTIDEPMYSHSSSQASSSAGFSNDEVEITHEIWFPAPTYLKTPQAQFRHHIAQRNFFALLYNRPIVGSDFFEMLTELQTVIDTFYELDNKGQTQWSAQMVARYLLLRRLDDVRNNIKHALGLLAWCEQDNVRWMAGYLEAFVHCAGMMTHHIQEYPEFKRLSTVTRRNLDAAASMLQLRVLETEEKLATFDFSELWPVLPKNAGPSAYQRSFTAFQGFLIGFYSRVYKSWPPPVNSKGKWLTREVVRRLQQDLGALYDYLVDREVSWNEQEERAGRKWQMVTKRPLPEDLYVDLPDLPLTDIFVQFDNKHGYLHIPHPYPLLPQNTKTSAPAPAKKGLFGGLKKSKPTAPPIKDAKELLQIALAFNDATNLDKLGVSFESKFSHNGETRKEHFEWLTIFSE